MLVTTAYVSTTGGSPVVNGFVISNRDLDAAKERSMKYFAELSPGEDEDTDESMSDLSASPSRIYPVNNFNLSRMDDVGEIALYRYSMHTLLNVTRSTKLGGKTSPEEAAKRVVPAYPVVMFRSDVVVQWALLNELFNR